MELKQAPCFNKKKEFSLFSCISHLICCTSCFFRKKVFVFKPKTQKMLLKSSPHAYIEI